MKRFFSIIMLVLVLVSTCCITIPVSAASADDFIGIWYLNDVLEPLNVTAEFDFTMKGTEYNKLELISTGSEFKIIRYNKNISSSHYYYKDSTGYVYSNDRTIEITTAPDLSTTGNQNFFYFWLKNNAVKAEKRTLLDYAKDVVADAQKNIDTNANYWLVTKNSETNYTVYLSTTPFSYSVTDKVLSYGSGTVRKTTVTDSDGTFAYNGWGTISTSTFAPSGEPIAVSNDIEGFFPIPLHQVVLGATQGGLVETLPALGGTIPTLVLCGVGLMALLVVLSLFGKRSQIFHL